MKCDKEKIIAVAGPTASGKSELALKLCLKYGGELVCCDSMQIYTGMDIGTAKPTAEERERVVHHMCDFLDPGTAYSAADYARDACRCAEDILNRGKIPVICGGTGLYLDALLFQRPWDESDGHTEIRDRLAAEAAADGAHAMWERLKLVDPESAAAIHQNNIRRVIRALEIYELTGVPKSVLDRRAGNPRYDALCLVLHRSDRSEQNSRIEARVDRMLEAGLADETEMLLKKGVFDGKSTASQAIGYKEMLGYVRGICTLGEAREELITATRRYAKRQDTWFAHREYCRTIEISREHPDPYPEVCELIDGFLK